MYIGSLPNPSNVNFAYFVPIVKVTHCKQYIYERSREECYNGHLRPLQFNYLSYELFLEKKSCQTPPPKKKKVDFGVLRTKVVWKFSVRLKKKEKKC